MRTSASTFASLNTIRTNLQSARGQSATAESQFKAIETDSDSLRKVAASIETYEARHDEDRKDVSDEGKAAVKALAGVARKQQGLESAHQTEEAARRQLGSDLGEALGDSQALDLPPGEKYSLLSAISNAQQSDQSGNWNYQNVDTALYAANLQLPSAQEYAGDIAGDDKRTDVRLKGEFLQQTLDRLEKSYGDATSAADRSEAGQDRVGDYVDTALRELDRLEDKAVQPYLEDVPFVAFAGAMRRAEIKLQALKKTGWAIFA